MRIFTSIIKSQDLRLTSVMQSINFWMLNASKKLHLMETLVDGFKKHPAYKEIRTATGNC